jgi:hypothetical protein
MVPDDGADRDATLIAPLCVRLGRNPSRANDALMFFHS